MNKSMEEFNKLDRNEKIMYLYKQIEETLEGSFLYDEPFDIETASIYEFVVVAFHLGIQLSEKYKNKIQDEDERRSEEIIRNMRARLN